MGLDSTMLLIGLLAGMVIGLTGVVGFLLGKRSRKTSVAARCDETARVVTGTNRPTIADERAGGNASAGVDASYTGNAADCFSTNTGMAVSQRTSGETDALKAQSEVNPRMHLVVDDPDFVDVDEGCDEVAGSEGAHASAEYEPGTPGRDKPLDMHEFARDLALSEDPLAQLKRFAKDVKKQAAAAAEGKANEPDAISAYLARGLEEAGLLKHDIKLPAAEAVLPGRSRTIYLRTSEGADERELRSVIAVEGALNRALFAWEGTVMSAAQQIGDEPADVAANDSTPSADGPSDSTASDAGVLAANSSNEAGPSALAASVDNAASADMPSDSEADSTSSSFAMAANNESDQRAADGPTIEECYAFNQGLVSSLCAQLGHSPIPRASMFDVNGEWGARQTFSAGLESIRTPLRLTASWRMNLMGGDIAIETPFVPASCQPGSVYSHELGRVIPATHQMREQMATDYALRCAILLAAHAFRSSRRLCHAYVAVMGSGRTRRCLVSGDVSREQLRNHDLSQPFDARELARELGIRFNLENDRLTGVEQGFALESEKFCPASRYEVVDLSKRVLPRFEAELLGAERVSDLSINEDAHRIAVAEDVASGLGGSVERNVRRILNITQADRDRTVREAGKRCAAALIAGDLSENDPLAFTDEFVAGDALSRACERSIDLLAKRRSAEAIELLCDALAPVDALDTYRDADGVTWRNFSSYVARALYNRLLAHEGDEVRLVPDAYYGAQLLMSSALLQQGRAAESLGFARRASDLNPFDLSGALRATRALELTGDLEGAAAELRRNLEFAHDPQGVGTLYYRLAFIEWKLGHAELTDACYQKALVSRATCSPAAKVELAMLRAKEPACAVEPEEVEDLLASHGIPLAPTERVLEVLVEAAQGATDAEVFPVAKSFATLLGALSADDVMHGVAASIEREPDR